MKPNPVNEVQILAWMNDNNVVKWSYNITYKDFLSCYRFAKKSDAILFKLTWC
jgi:hypothetical protein